jgi:hypothetical protein
MADLSTNNLNSLIPPYMQPPNPPPEEREEDYIDAEKIIKTSILPDSIAKIIGLVKDLRFTIGTLFSRFHHAANYEKVIGNRETAKGIVVLIHGLNAHPSQMDGHVKAFKEKFGEDILIYQVRVEKKGNCSKSEAIKRIEDTVLPILKDSPHLKLYAHGISNGGRLASQLAVDVIKNGVSASKIMVSANSAPLYGTKAMCDPSSSPWKQKIWKRVVQSRLAGKHTEVIYNDLTWGSQSAKQIIKDIREAADQGVEFEFYGSFADSKVTPGSFYPKNVRNAKYFHPSNIQGHSSIVGDQRKRQLENAYAFLSR